MDNPEEILHSLEEFTKLKPKDIPRELEEYLSFVAKTGDPVYQWGTIKSLFREKLINVTTELYESCPSMEIPPSPNVEVFNYEKMKSFILEKLDTFVAAPFTVQRICELLTSPRKEYNRIDKYMRALEKNILVVSTIEPGNRRTENGEGIVNGVESELYEENQTSNEKTVEDTEMEETPWPKSNISYNETEVKMPHIESVHSLVEGGETSLEVKMTEIACSGVSVGEKTVDRQLFVSIEPVPSDNCLRDDDFQETSVTITAVPAPVQKRRDSIEPIEETNEGLPSSDSQTVVKNEIMTPISSSILSNNEQYTDIVPSPSNIEDADSIAETSVNIQIEDADAPKNLDQVQDDSENVSTSMIDPVGSFMKSVDTNRDENPIKNQDEYSEHIEDKISQDLDFVISGESSLSDVTVNEESTKEETDTTEKNNSSCIENCQEVISFPLAEVNDATPLILKTEDNPINITYSSKESLSTDCQVSPILENDETRDNDQLEGHEKTQLKDEISVDFQPAVTKSMEENVHTE